MEEKFESLLRFVQIIIVIVKFDISLNIIHNVGMNKSDYLKLHLSVLLSGFTGLFAKLVSLNEGLIVFYRMLLAFGIFAVFFIRKRPQTKDGFKISSLGVLLAVHLIFFFGSIKYSNVSIGVVCYSLVGFFTVIFEPLIRKTKFSLPDLCYSLLAVLGIWMIFSFDSSFRVGIILGVISAALFALYTLYNKVIEVGKSTNEMLFYEFFGGSVFMIAFLPFYLWLNPVQTILPTGIEWVWIFILAFFCTVLLYLFHIGALKTISPATVSLTGNLEPIYGVLFAMIFLGEAQDLNAEFYIGMILILSSVFMQSFLANFRLASFTNRSCRVHARSRSLD